MDKSAITYIVAKGPVVLSKNFSAMIENLNINPYLLKVLAGLEIS
jgi:hypothetical protein